MSRKLLTSWMDHAKVYRVLHNAAASHYQSRNTYYKIPSIIITAISAALAFSVQAFPNEVDIYIPVLVGVFNLVAGVFTSICSFKRLPELAEGNRIAAIQYSKLHRRIKEKLIVNRNDDELIDFMTTIREEMDNLIESSPAIQANIIRAFKRKHGKTKLSLPVVVNLGGLEISRSSKHHRRHKNFNGNENNQLEKSLKNIDNIEISIDSKDQMSSNVQNK